MTGCPLPFCRCLNKSGGVDLRRLADRGERSGILSYMARTEIKIIGIKSLKEAIKRNPARVKTRARTFLQRGLAVYRRGIINDPWRVGGRGGGAPVSNDPRYRTSSNKGSQRARSGNLRDTHRTQINGLIGFIGPSTQAAPYAKMVHDGTRRMKARPWLNHTKKTKAGEIGKLYRDMLKEIVRDLAK